MSVCGCACCQNTVITGTCSARDRGPLLVLADLDEAVKVLPPLLVHDELSDGISLGLILGLLAPSSILLVHREQFQTTPQLLEAVNGQECKCKARLRCSSQLRSARASAMLPISHACAGKHFQYDGRLQQV